MKNQLDLQESEWEAYEETFNNIAEQLDDVRNEVEVVKAERDALLAQQSEWKEAISASSSTSTSASESEYKQLFLNLQKVYTFYIAVNSIWTLCIHTLLSIMYFLLFFIYHLTGVLVIYLFF